ncbi:hypothetical protein C8F04DRAFT_1268039 [Mycena alexandri]|uniref:Uncharacterized protein n=1 Tax=Mycena alexandri TaxID=1745969 RepID=A0AAD6SF74_9AGAR|nr:hypothetical protein C8F04DRAFT_1268039 [Mycena alexandri]
MLQATRALSAIRSAAVGFKMPSRIRDEHLMTPFRTLLSTGIPVPSNYCIADANDLHGIYLCTSLPVCAHPVVVSPSFDDLRLARRVRTSLRAAHIAVNYSSAMFSSVQ